MQINGAAAAACVSVSPDTVKCTSVQSKCAADVLTIANICVNKFKNCVLAVKTASHKQLNYFWNQEQMVCIYNTLRALKHNCEPIGCRFGEQFGNSWYFAQRQVDMQSGDQD